MTLHIDETNTTNIGCGLPVPTFLPRRYKPRNVGEWTGHLAFAADLIAATQPKLIVELGTHWGEAYFTFCQAVEEQRLTCVCYAVDHWRGDEHAGQYGEDVFNEVREYNDRYYKQFSYLLRRSFDDARSQFADGSIDLLHIDGYHTYEAVTGDFRSWLPKVSEGGIVLLHDTCVRHQDFGVWRFWEELTAEFPETFEFHHSWGLGVIRKPGGAQRSQLLELLFESSPAMQEEIRRHYVLYASRLEAALGPDVAERNLTAERLSKMASELAAATAARDGAIAARDAATAARDAAESQFRHTQEALRSTQALLRTAQDQLHGMQHSLSWRVTEPIRRLMTMLRSGRARGER